MTEDIFKLIKSTKEIRKINKHLKAQDLGLVATGQVALEMASVPFEVAQKLANIQEAQEIIYVIKRGKAFILGKKRDIDLMDVIQYQDEHPLDEILLKYELLAKTKELLSHIKEKISRKYIKVRSYYENAILNLSIDNVFHEFATLPYGSEPLTHFLKKAINQYLFKHDPLFSLDLISTQCHDVTCDDAWFMVTHAKGEKLFLFGESHHQLTAFITKTDFLNDYEIIVDYNADMHKGWAEVVEKQISLGQSVQENTRASLDEYRIINELGVNHIQDSAILLNYQIQMIKQRLLPIQDKRAHEQTCRKLNKELKKLQFKLQKAKYEPIEVKAVISEKVARVIKDFPIYQQVIPQDFIIYYLYDLNERILMDENLALEDEHSELICHLIEHCDEYQLKFPEALLKVYLHKVDSLDKEAQNKQIEMLTKAQQNLKSFILQEWLHNTQKEDSVQTVLIDHQTIQKEISTLLKSINQAKAMKGRKNKAIAFHSLSEDIAKVIQSYPEHRQKIPFKLIDQYLMNLKMEILNSKNEEEYHLNENNREVIAILVEHCQHLKPRLHPLIMRSYLQGLDRKVTLDADSVYYQNIHTFPQTVEKLSQLQPYLRSEVLDEWILRKKAILASCEESTSQKPHYKLINRIKQLMSKKSLSQGNE